MNRLLLLAILASSLALGLHAGSTHAHAAAPSRYAQLVAATNNFSYWISSAPASRGVPASYVNAQASRYIIAGYPHRAGGSVIGKVVGDLHLMNLPSGHRFHIDSFTSSHAVETVRWLFGSNPHTPIDRLYWTYTPSGWKIAAVQFVRVS